MNRSMLFGGRNEKENYCGNICYCILLITCSGVDRLQKDIARTYLRNQSGCPYLYGAGLYFTYLHGLR